MKRFAILIGAMFFAISCAANSTPTPIRPPAGGTVGAVVVVTSTAVPAVELSPTVEPSATSVLSTAVPVPTLAATVPPATGTRSPAAGTTRVAPTAPRVVYKFLAPVPLGPLRPTIFKDGNSIRFTYTSVGPLAPNQCYLFHIEMINPNVNPGNRGDDFLDKDHCGDRSVIGKPLTFTLYNGKFRNAPNYGTILPQARALAPLAPKQVLRVTWFVRLVQNNGISSDGVHYQVVPLSFPSAVLDFDFEP